MEQQLEQNKTKIIQASTEVQANVQKDVQPITLDSLAQKYQIKRVRGSCDPHQLKKIDFTNKQVTFQQVLFLLTALPNLPQLIFQRCYNLPQNLCFDTFTFKHIKKLELVQLKIKSLQIKECFSIQSLTVLGCPALKNVDIYDCQTLKRIKINFSPIFIVNLKNLQQLHSLDLSISSYLDTINLSGCPHVKWLDLSRSQIRFYQLNKLLQNIQQLESLNLQFCQNQNMKKIHFKGAKCKNLKILNLNHIIEAKFITLQDLPQLTSLQMAVCYRLSYLRIQKCPKLLGLSLYPLKKVNCIQLLQLDSLNLFNMYHFGVQFLKISKCKSLKKLNFGRYYQINIQTIHLQELQSLQQLDLQLNSENSVINIIKNPSFKKLQFFSTENVKSLVFQQLPKFEQLNIRSYTTIFQQISLKECNNLIKIDLNQTKLSSQQIANFIAGQTKLQMLNLSGCACDKLKLNDCKQLQVAQLNNTGNSLIFKQISSSNLQKLYVLYLQSNRINNIQPLGLINLFYLKTIDLSKNQIWNVRVLQKTHKIAKKLYLQQNPILLHNFQRGIIQIQYLTLTFTANLFQHTNVFKLESTMIGNNNFRVYPQNTCKFMKMVLKKYPKYMFDA